MVLRTGRNPELVVELLAPPVYGGPSLSLANPPEVPVQIDLQDLAIPGLPSPVVLTWSNPLPLGDWLQQEVLLSVYFKLSRADSTDSEIHSFNLVFDTVRGS